MENHKYISYKNEVTFCILQTFLQCGGKSSEMETVPPWVICIFRCMVEPPRYRLMREVVME
uniref:Uncharacterized protein n=1 Tax=Anguilla anguilla TaxID=7936 RepID=A0A0E9WY09_ANGAN